MEEFPCRTKVISGTRYRIAMYDAAGDKRMSTSNESEEEALDYVRRMKELLSKDGREGVYSFKITPEPWTEEVCIECGRESW
jgi:hypothetical protein